MHTTEIECDRCRRRGIVVDNKEPFILYKIGFAYQSSYCYDVRMFEGPRAEWCRNCLVETGIVPPNEQTAREVKPAKQAPSIQDMIRQIAREEAAAEIADDVKDRDCHRFGVGDPS